MNPPPNFKYPIERIPQKPKQMKEEEISDWEWQSQRLPNHEQKLKECERFQRRFFECERFHSTEYNEAKNICGVYRIYAQDCFGKVLCPLKSDLVNLTCSPGNQTTACWSAIRDYNYCLFQNDVPPLIEPDKIIDPNLLSQMKKGFLARLKDEKSLSRDKQKMQNLMSERPSKSTTSSNSM